MTDLSKLSAVDLSRRVVARLEGDKDVALEALGELVYRAQQSDEKDDVIANLRADISHLESAFADPYYRPSS